MDFERRICWFEEVTRILLLSTISFKYPPLIVQCGCLKHKIL